VYEYDEFGRLVSHRDPQNREAAFEYTNGRLSSITDRAGTESRFTYDTWGRVTSKIEVTDPIAGTGPTTEYTYNADNTVVEDPSGFLTTYYAQQPPAPTVVRHVTAGAGAPSLQLAGSLPSLDGKTLAQSAVYELDIDSNDDNGVEALTIAVDDSLVEEVACEDNDCEHSWSFDTSEHVPGEHAIRTWATDELGNRRLRAVIVKVPPWEPPAAVDPPTAPTQEERFEAALAFREALGLNTDEGHIEIVDQDPSAQDAVSRWGVPLTSGELTIMSDRQELEADAAHADAYVAGSVEASAVYAGSYLDPSNGTLHIGFTDDANEHLAEMLTTFPQPNRLEVYTADHTLAELEATNDQIDADLVELVAEGIDIREVTLLEDANVVRIGVASVTAAEEAELLQRYGSAVDVVESDGFETAPGPPINRAERFPRIHAGLHIRSTPGDPDGPGCSSNVSAFRRVDPPGPATSAVRYFHLTAGHCGGPQNIGDEWYQGGKKFGATVQDYYVSGSRVDGELIRVTRQRTSTYLAGARLLFEMNSIQKRGRPFEKLGMMVCKAGYRTNVTCGEITAIQATVRLPDGTVLYRQRRADFFNCSGDSGGIVYRPLERRKAMAVGIYAGGRNRGECPWFEAFYSHLRWAENDMQLKVCIRGRARCGR
jgi:YD repeat-containing protein